MHSLLAYSLGLYTFLLPYSMNSYRLYYCREWGFVAGFHDFSDFVMRELCGIIVSIVFTPNRERASGLRFVQQYRTFENYYAGCR